MNTPRNNPVINADDPKWTAYVLGELDETERAGIERLLETSEEARALVEELTVATVSMKEELSSFLPLMMSPEQRAAIRSAAEPKPRRWFEGFPSKWGLGLAAAAMLLLAVGIPVALKEKESDSAVPVAEKKQDSLPAVLPQVSIVRNEAAPPAGPQAKETELRESGASKLGATTATSAVSQERLARVAVEAPATNPPAAPPAANPAPATPPAVLTASVFGTVQDSSTALIPGVTVTATNASTGNAVSTRTTGAGTYYLRNLPPGTYNLSASLPGFQSQTVTNLPVGSEDQARVNYTLQVAAQTTAVEVSVSADQLIQAGAASVGEVLPEQRVANLPLVGNNVLDLLNILPGNRGSDRKDETAVAGVRSQEVAGQGLNSLNVTRDGLPLRDERFSAQAGTFQGEALGGTAGQQAQQAQQGQQGQQGQQAAGQSARQGQQGQGQVAGAGARGGGGAGGAAGGGGRGGRGGVPAAVAAPPPPPPAPAPPPPPAAVARAAIDNNARLAVPNTEAYDSVEDNPFIRTTQENLATFSIDVDTASYANVRRFLNQNQLPPKDAVRIEELLNYFNYDYAQPTGDAPIAPNLEVAATPWNPTNRLVRIGIKAREVNANRRPPSNLVFLVDVSGSMNSPERLPLVKTGLNMLVERLGENDTVSIVVYAGQSGLALAPTSGMRKEVIRQAIDSLQPGGSTNGASGIQLAYNQAVANFVRGGVNRVVLMTDGDFNVGVTNQSDLTRLIEDRARSGVFLSVLGFGMGNYKDSTLERLADQGNGNYAYIDNVAEARKVLVEEMSGTLITVAKDVKIQVDFNPARVEAYRLIGYENRILRTQDFNNDAKDAGDMGAGHTVTALFEVVPKGGEVPGPSIDPSIYTQPRGAASADAARGNAAPNSNEMLTLRVRYKQPDSDTSTRMDVPLVDRGTAFARASTDFRFAAGVAEFGMILRGSPYRGSSRMDTVLDIVEGSQGADRSGYRREFISLVQKARNLGR